MSIYFINSTDRLYEDRDLNKIYKLFLKGGGVLNTSQDTIDLWKSDGDLQVKVNSGMDLTVNPGLASKILSIRSEAETCLVEVKAEQDLTIAANSSGDDRVDAIVVRIDKSVIDDDEINTTGSNVVTVEIVTGSGNLALSDGDIDTALGGDPFIRLADVTVGDGVSSIASDKIEDTRVHAEMNNSIVLGGERYRFTGLDADPSDAQTGDVWFATSEEALKLKTSDSIITFTSSSFDIYQDGISTQNIQGSDVISNTAEIGVVNLDLYEFGSDPVTSRTRLEWWQIFEAPISDLGSLLLKKGVAQDDENRGVKFEIYTVDGSNEPDTLIESFTYDFSQWEEIDPYTWFEMKLTGSYSASTRYGVLCYLNTTSEPEDPASIARAETTDDNIEAVYRRYNDTFGTSGIEGYAVQEYSLALRLTQRETEDFGTSTNARLGQTFISETTTLKGIVLKKGDDNGTPTGNITASIYEADVDDEPIGQAIASKVITEEEWNDIDVDDEFTLELVAGLGLGIKYIFYLEPENISDTNYRELWAAKTNNIYTNGKMRGYNGVSNWFDVNYDLYFKVIEGAENKLVKTLVTGKIALELMPDEVLKSVSFQLLSGGSLGILDSTGYITSSPSGKTICFSQENTNDNFYFFKVDNGVISYIDSVAIPVADGSYGSFIDDNRFLISGNDTSTDIVKVYEVDPYGSPADINYTSDTPLFSFSYTGLYINIMVNHNANTVSVGYGPDDFRIYDMSDWSFITTQANVPASNCGLRGAIIRLPNGYYIHNYTNTILEANVDGTFTAAGTSTGFSNYFVPTDKLNQSIQFNYFLEGSANTQKWYAQPGSYELTIT